MIQKIAIIGAGRIGKAIHYALDHMHCEKCMWDIDESLLDNPVTLKQAVRGAEVIFLGIPSWALRQGVRDILEHVTTRVLFVAVTKGLESKTHATVDEVLAEELQAHHDFALMSGPMMAEEIVRDMRAGAVIATASQESYTKLTELFAESKIITEYSNQVRAVALAAVLKNVYSLGFGLIDGLGLSGNEKGIVFAHMFQEQMRIQELLGGNPQASLGLAGLGDMVCTGFSQYSRQRTTGEALIKTGAVSKKSESVHSLPSLLELLGDNQQQFSFLLAIKAIVVDHQNAQQTIDSYFSTL